MWMLITQRVIRFTRSATPGDRYAARHANEVVTKVSGPFLKRSLADRAAVAALTTHTCLSAQVLTEEQFVALAEASQSSQPDYELGNAVRNARKWLLAK